MAFLRFVPIFDNSALPMRVRIIFLIGPGDHYHTNDPASHPYGPTINQYAHPDGGANRVGDVIWPDAAISVSRSSACRANPLLQHGNEHGGNE